MEDYLNILHISDLHLKEKELEMQDHFLLKLLDNIKDKIKNKNLKINYIAITGDVTWSCKIDEFREVDKFLNKLMEITKVKLENIFIVPGNHDKDKNHLKESIECLRKNYFGDPEQFKKFWLNENERILIFESQNGFFTWYNNKFGKRNFLDCKNMPYYFLNINHEGKIIRLIGYNTSWLSLGIKEERDMILGTNQMLQCIDNKEETILTIILMHHPSENLISYDRSFFESEIMKKSDIILQGHLHMDYVKADFINGTLIIAAGPGFEHKKSYLSYNIISYRYSTRELTYWIETYMNVHAKWSEYKDTHILPSKRELISTLSTREYEEINNKYNFDKIVVDFELSQIMDKYVINFPVYKNSALVYQCQYFLGYLNIVINPSDIDTITNKFRTNGIIDGDLEIQKIISAFFVYYLNKYNGGSN